MSIEAASFPDGVRYDTPEERFTRPAAEIDSGRVPATTLSPGEHQITFDHPDLPNVTVLVGNDERGIVTLRSKSSSHGMRSLRRGRAMSTSTHVLQGGNSIVFSIGEKTGGKVYGLLRHVERPA